MLPLIHSPLHDRRAWRNRQLLRNRTGHRLIHPTSEAGWTRKSRQTCYFSWCRLRNTCPESLCEDRPSPERNGNDFPVLSCIRFTFCKRQKTAFSLSPDWPAIQKRLTPDSLVHVKADKNENKRSGLSALCVFHQTVSILFSHL